jgi:hypothetical protein
MSLVILNVHLNNDTYDKLEALEIDAIRQQKDTNDALLKRIRERYNDNIKNIGGYDEKTVNYDIEKVKTVDSINYNPDFTFSVKPRQAPSQYMEEREEYEQRRLAKRGEGGEERRVDELLLLRQINFQEMVELCDTFWTGELRKNTFFVLNEILVRIRDFIQTGQTFLGRTLLKRLEHKIFEITKFFVDNDLDDQEFDYHYIQSIHDSLKQYILCNMSMPQYDFTTKCNLVKLLWLPLIMKVYQKINLIKSETKDDTRVKFNFGEHISLDKLDEDIIELIKNYFKDNHTLFEVKYYNELIFEHFSNRPESKLNYENRISVKGVAHKLFGKVSTSFTDKTTRYGYLSTETEKIRIGEYRWYIMVIAIYYEHLSDKDKEGFTTPEEDQLLQLFCVLFKTLRFSSYDFIVNDKFKTISKDDNNFLDRFKGSLSFDGDSYYGDDSNYRVSFFSLTQFDYTRVTENRFIHYLSHISANDTNIFTSLDKLNGQTVFEYLPNFKFMQIGTSDVYDYRESDLDILLNKITMKDEKPDSRFIYENTEFIGDSIYSYLRIINKSKEFLKLQSVIFNIFMLVVIYKLYKEKFGKIKFKKEYIDEIIDFLRLKLNPKKQEEINEVDLFEPYVIQNAIISLDIILNNDIRESNFDISDIIYWYETYFYSEKLYKGDKIETKIDYERDDEPDYWGGGKIPIQSNFEIGEIKKPKEGTLKNEEPDKNIEISHNYKMVVRGIDIRSFGRSETTEQDDSNIKRFLFLTYEILISSLSGLEKDKLDRLKTIETEARDRIDSAEKVIGSHNMPILEPYNIGNYVKVNEIDHTKHIVGTPIRITEIDREQYEYDNLFPPAFMEKLPTDVIIYRAVSSWGENQHIHKKYFDKVPYNEVNSLTKKYRPGRNDQWDYTMYSENIKSLRELNEWGERPILGTGMRNSVAILKETPNESIVILQDKVNFFYVHTLDDNKIVYQYITNIYFNYWKLIYIKMDDYESNFSSKRSTLYGGGREGSEETIKILQRRGEDGIYTLVDPFFIGNRYLYDNWIFWIGPNMKIYGEPKSSEYHKFGRYCLKVTVDRSESKVRVFKAKYFFKDNRCDLETLDDPDGQFELLDITDIIKIPSFINTFKQILKLSDYNETMFWRKDNDIIIEMPKYNLILNFNLDDHKLRLEDGNELLITTNNYIYNRWIYGIPNAFLIRGKNGYEILIFTNLSSIKDDQHIRDKWIKSSAGIKNVKFGNRYYSIPIHMSGLFLIPNNLQSISFYFLCCMYYNKVECLKRIESVIDKYIKKEYLVDDEGDAGSKYDVKHADQDKKLEGYIKTYFPDYQYKSTKGRSSRDETSKSTTSSKEFIKTCFDNIIKCNYNPFSAYFIVKFKHSLNILDTRTVRKYIQLRWFYDDQFKIDDKQIESKVKGSLGGYVIEKMDKIFPNVTELVETIKSNRKRKEPERDYDYWGGGLGHGSEFKIIDNAGLDIYKYNFLKFLVLTNIYSFYGDRTYEDKQIIKILDSHDLYDDLNIITNNFVYSLTNLVHDNVTFKEFEQYHRGKNEDGYHREKNREIFDVVRDPIFTHFELDKKIEPDIINIFFRSQFVTDNLIKNVNIVIDDVRKPRPITSNKLYEKREDVLVGRAPEPEQDYARRFFDDVSNFRDQHDKYLYTSGQNHLFETKRKVQEQYDQLLETLNEYVLQKENDHFSINMVDWTSSIINGYGDDTIKRVVLTTLRLNYTHFILAKIDSMLKDGKEDNNVGEIHKLGTTMPSYTLGQDVSYLIIIYEFIFGFYLRNEQLELTMTLYNEILDGKFSNVYQMLMGKGKTSVISPVLTLLLISNPKFNSIVHVMPESIIKQSHSNMVKYIGNLFDVDILNIKYDRGSFTIDDMIRENSIMIMSDNSLKAFKLNFFNQSKGESFNRVKEILDQNVFIMDEIDDMYNPVKSELNYPIGTPQMLDMFYLSSNILYDVILSLYFDNRYDDVRDTLYEQPNVKSKPHLIITEYNEDIRKILLPLFLDVINKHNEPFKEYVDFERLIINNDIILKRDLSENEMVVTNTIYHIFARILPAIVGKIHRLNFGLGNLIGVPTANKVRKELLIAVPFTSQDRPDLKSEFSDPLITLGLTILAYNDLNIHGLRYHDIDRYIKFLSYNFSQDPIPNFHKRLSYQQFSDLMEGVRGNYPMINNFPTIYDFTEDQIDTMKLNRKGIRGYLMDYILPQLIRITKHQMNLSFIDVMTSDFCNHRCFFSGTPFIDLPKQISEYKPFGEIVYEKGSDGSVVAAMLGLVGTKPKLVTNGTESGKDDESWIIEKITSRDSGYSCLIDTGAIFIKYAPIDLAKIILKNLVKRNSDLTAVVFIDKDHIPKAFTLDQDTSISLSKLPVPLNRRFVYIDQSHMVGIDIKMDINTHALVTINHFVTYRDVAQGIFRLRQINQGQTIDFFIEGKLWKYIGSDLGALVEWLLFKNYSFHKSQKLMFFVQNIRSLYREVVWNKRIKLRVDDVFNYLNENIYIQPSTTLKPRTVDEIKNSYIDWFILEATDINKNIRGDVNAYIVELTSNLKQLLIDVPRATNTSSQQIEQLRLEEYELQSISQQITTHRSSIEHGYYNRALMHLDIYMDKTHKEHNEHFLTYGNLSIGRLYLNDIEKDKSNHVCMDVQHSGSSGSSELRIITYLEAYQLIFHLNTMYKKYNDKLCIRNTMTNK